MFFKDDAKLNLEKNINKLFKRNLCKQDDERTHI